MRNFLQVNRALAAKKNFQLVNRALAAEKNVFTLHSISNPDGQPTVNRQSAVALQSGKRSEKAPLGPTCLRNLSRIAMIFAVLALSIANIGMAWGETASYSFTAASVISSNFTETKSNSTNIVTTVNQNSPGGAYTGKALKVEMKNNSNLEYTLVTVNSFSNISNITFNFGTGSSARGNIKLGVDISSTADFSSDVTTLMDYSQTWQTSYNAYSGSNPDNSKMYQVAKTVSNKSGYVRFRITNTSSGKTAFLGDVTITYGGGGGCSATADAGADKSTTVGVGVAMAATAASSGYTGAWSIKAGSPSTATSQLSSTSSATATFTPTAAGTYTLVWTVTDNSDGTCSAMDEATVTVTAPTHTVTATTDNASYGTAAAAKTTVAEGATTTITATPKSGYAFDHWTVSGTGATLSSTSTNPTTLTMGTGDVTVTAYFVEKTCPSSGTLYTAVAAATGDISIDARTSNLELNNSTHKTTVTGGSMYVFNEQTSAKKLITSSGFSMTNNNTYFKLVLDCALEEGDVISVDVGKQSDAARGVWITTATSRPSSAPACALTATNASLTPVTYTVTGSDDYRGETVLYIYRATGNTTYFNNINISRPVACSTPDAPTGFTAGSITSTGATFTITDAANAASYDIYYSTSSTDPTAETEATTTSTEKTKAVTGLTANTTYNAWVRSVCDADHKSAWVALSGSSFETTSTPAELTAIEANVLYQAADMANITFTGSDQWFAGLSTNAKFKTYGDGSSTSAKGKTVSSTSITDDIDTKNFTSIAYIMTADNTSSTSDPTKGAIEFITPSTAGYLYLYFENTSSALTLKKKGTSTPTSLSGAKYKKVAVEANTHYFINGAGSNRGLYGIKLILDETAPTFVSSVPANGATDVATSGTIVLTFSEALGSVDESKFTLTGATKGTVTIDGSDATKVNIIYTGAENSSTVTLATAAAAVSDVAGNALAAALSDISFTTAAGAPAGLTALECNTLYKVEHMVPASITLSEMGQYAAGLSANTKFEVIGDPAAAANAGGTPEMKNEAASFAEQSFTARMYLKGASNTTGSGTTFVPTSRALKFIVGTTGTLDIYAHRVDRLYLKKEGDSGTTQLGSSTSGSGSMVSHNVTAGTYYIYSVNSSTCIYGVRLNCANTVTYKPNGGTGSDLVVNDLTARDNPFTAPSGKAFDGWNTAADGSGTDYAVGATISSDITLFAQWKDAYTVTYKANGGTGADVVDDAASEVASNPFSYSGHSFTGWDTAADGTGTSYAVGDAVTSNLTLYAQWEEVFVRDCEELVVVTATSTTAVDASVGTVVSEKLSEGNQFTAIDGYTYAVKPATSGKLTLSPKAGKSFAAGDSLIFIVHNGNSGEKIEGFKIGSSTHTHSVAGNSLYYIRIELTASDIVDGKVEITRNSSDDRWVAAIIKTCDVLPPCTTPVLPSLSDQEVCAGENGTAWDATITNEDALATTGETVSYEWKKKGSDVVLAHTASYTPTDVTAADAGIYVVTATVSKTGNSDATASAEVTLTVKFTATPMVTMTPSSIAPGETATLTATSSEGATFQWFKCDNAAGDNPFNVGSGASFTTSTLAAGSHYYKVVATGDGTHTCGTAELIYQVEVAIPEQCHTYYWFPYDADARTNDVTNNENKFFSGAKTGSSNGGTYNFSVDGESLTATKNTGSSSMTITFTIPSGKTGTLGINCKGSSSKPLYLTHSSGTPQLLVSDDSNNAAFKITGITPGEWTLTSAGSWTLSGMAVKVCTACEATTMDVSDAAPTYDMSAGGDFTEPTFTVKHNGSALSPQPALSYTSSNSAIATVNETTGALTFHGKTGTVTITATYSGDGTYCSSTASYTLTINCGSEEAPKIVLADGTNLTGCNTTITLHAKKQDGTDFTGGTYQWYRNGDVIEGATDASYTVARAGTYIVTRTGACVQESTNKAVITNTVDEPTVERLVPFQYYHEDKEYSAQMKDRHLFAVHSQGTLDDKPYSMTATRVSDDADVLSMVEGALWVKQGTGAGVGTDTVMIDLNLLIDQGLAAGDEVRFVCSAIACGGISPVNNDIILKVIDQTPTLAIICSGADGDGTRNKANYVLHGDFLTGYNKADLCLQTGGTTFDNTQELPLYTALKAHYRITPVNGYAPFKLLNYEPFDLLLLTDFPKTKLNSGSRTAQATNKMDSMYVLVDYRPMLSFKTHMVAKTPSSWAVKGFTTSPTVPDTSQTHMNIVCYAHPMFNALSHLATDEVSPDHDEEGQMVYKMLTGGGYDKKKGIQGFELSDAGNFVTIAFTRYNATVSAPAADGTVTWTPFAEDRKLIAACERQTNIEARMILLSINADALCKLTEAGIAMVDSTLQYLLESDPLKVADCSLTFDDNNGTGVWSDEKNWAPRYNQVPNADLGARIIKPCTVDNAEAMALSIKIEKEGKLIIPATSALIVESSIRHADGGNLSAPSADEISIAANASGSGTLILNNITEDTRASVQMYSKASTDQSADAANWRWQYIGTPFNDVTDAMTNYYGSWLYLWNNGWNAVPKSAPLAPFAGYCITHPDGARTYSMTGTLATTADQTITVPAEQYMVIANSWTAPIQIDNFTDDDLKNLAAKTIYFFNTGSDPNQEGSVQPAGVTGDARWAAGTYVPVPIHAAPYSGDSTISAMQGFYVVGGVSEGSIHLDYDRLVRPQKTGQNIVSGPMHVRRRAAAADGEPNVLKLFVGGNRYDDRLILLEREDFTNGFDDGWDGDKWSDNSVAPALWTLRNDNTHEAVSAIPDFEGTIIGFQAGEDDEYTFRFDYSGEADAIYLLDTKTKVYTRVLTGNTYTFTTADNAEHQRFVLTRSDAPQVATGVEPASDSSLKGRAKKLLIEDKLYILLNGMLYDATGKVVR